MAIFDFLNSQQTGTQNVTTSIDPQIKQAYLSNLNFADSVASRPFEQYGGPRIAGFNPDQLAAFQGVRDMQGSGQQFVGGAANTFQNLMGFNPQQIQAQNAQAAMAQGVGYNPALAQRSMLGPAFTVSGVNAGPAAQTQGAQIDRGQIQNVSPTSFLQGNIGAFQNPYQDQVIDQVAKDLSRQQAIDRQGLNAQAIRQGAFGGTRQAIAEQEMGRNYADQFARTASQLRNQGFDTAANLLQADIGRGMQAQQANQGADINVATQNAGFGQQAGLSNQAANNAQNQFNAGLAQQAGMANQNALNQFAQTQFGSDSALNQFNAGSQNQAGQFGASAQNTANFANQNALNQFGLANQAQNFNAQTANQQAGLAGAGIRAGAASQFAGLGNTQQNLRQADINALMGIGQAQQGQVQRNYDLANQDFQNQFNYPVQQLAIRQGALGANIPNTGQTQSTPIYQNQAGQILGALQGVNSLFGNQQGGGTSFLGGIGSGIGSSLSGLLDFDQSGGLGLGDFSAGYNRFFG